MIHDTYLETLRERAQKALDRGGMWSQFDNEITSRDVDLVCHPTTVAWANFIGAFSPEVALALVDEAIRSRVASRAREEAS